MQKRLSNPYHLFLADSMGALITAGLILLITRFNAYFSMPHHALVVLAGIALIYSVYSFCCYRWQPKTWRTYLKVLLLANLVYCCTTLTLLVYFRHLLTGWDWVYFISEIGIICTLIRIEYRVACNPGHNNQLP